MPKVTKEVTKPHAAMKRLNLVEARRSAEICNLVTKPHAAMKRLNLWRDSKKVPKNKCYKTARGYEALKPVKNFGVRVYESDSYKTARGYEALKLCALKPAHRAGEKAQKGK